jgi:two-component system chemotaxis sensor kinase CheA
VFEVNGELYGANTNSIVEICRVPESEIRTSNGASLFFFRDKFIRCIDARRHLSTSGGLSKEQKDTASLFVLDARGELVAIRISWAMANTEVVVKPVPPLLPRNDFVQGMSILPTGKAIFILSLDKLVEPNRQRTGRPKEPSHEAA